jgi:hypothetical protein
VKCCELITGTIENVSLASIIGFMLLPIFIVLFDYSFINLMFGLFFIKMILLFAR